MSGLYDYRWQQARAKFLALPENVLCRCVECVAFKRRRVTNVVDHDPPHRGDPAKFWDRSSWRAMAKQCHDSFKQRLEKSGRIAGADTKGVPIDPRHPWNQPPRG
jgi:5-methylcytosine-specific restriction endonuclease McrA